MRFFRIMFIVAAVLAASHPSHGAVDEAVLGRARATLAKLSLEEKLALCASAQSGELGEAIGAGILKSWQFQELPYVDREGDADDEATILPSMAALASTWNTSLAEAAGDVIGSETRAMGRDMLLGPRVGLALNPLAGDFMWRLGEDPLLAQRMAVPFVRSVQSNDVAACVIPDGIPECGERALNEVRYRPLRSCIRDAGALGVEEFAVCGLQFAVLPDDAKEESPENPQVRPYSGIGTIVDGKLRDVWGFDGMVVPAHALAATNDVIDGRVPLSVVDEQTLRVLSVMERVKFFTPWERRKGEILTDAHHAVAQSIAEEAITLLKNDSGTLPLRPGAMRNILVIGELADVEMTHGETASWVRPKDEVTPFEGLVNQFAGRNVVIEKMPLNANERTQIFEQLVGEDENREAVEEDAGPAEEVLATGENAEGGQGEDVLRRVAPDAENLQTTAPPSDKATKPSEFAWRTEWFDNVKEPQEIAFKTGFAHRPGFAFGDAVPLAGMNKEAFCVRWSALLRAPESGEYSFRCHMNESGGAIIELDGKELVRGTGTNTVECTASLNAGEAYEFSVTYIAGEGEHRMRFDWRLPSDLVHFAAMREKAERADAVLVFIGTSVGEGAAKEGGEAARPNLRLPSGHDSAIAEILAWKSPKVVTVVHSAGPVELPWVEDCPTLLHLPYLGEAAGTAFAKVLFGEVAPSGKLVSSWPTRLELSPCAEPTPDESSEAKMQRAEGMYTGYRWHDKMGVPPLFAFGHGLSYAKFLYDMDNAEIAKFSGDEDSWAVSLPIKNIGMRPGKETVQIYAGYPNAKVERPVKELKAFAKTRLLAPGEEQTLTVKIRPRDLAYWDPFIRRFRLDAGEYQLIVAASASDIRGRATITVANDYIFE